MIADAHRDDGKRFAVRADEKLTAFLELESRPMTIIEIRPFRNGWQVVGSSHVKCRPNHGVCPTPNTLETLSRPASARCRRTAEDEQ
jgi:hypothetical protein